MKIKMRKVVHKLSCLRDVLFTDFQGDVNRFESTIGEVLPGRDFMNVLLVACGLDCLENNQITNQLIVMSLPLLFTVQYLICALHDDSDSVTSDDCDHYRLTFLLGDVGLAFGLYRRVYDTAVIAAFRGGLLAMVCNFIATLSRPQGRHQPVNWFYGWYACLTNDCSAMDTLILSDKDKIALWRFAYVVYLVTSVGSITVILGVSAFAYSTLLTHIPFCGLYIVTTFCWLAIYTIGVSAAVFFAVCFIAAFVTQMVCFVLQVRHACKRIKSVVCLMRKEVHQHWIWMGSLQRVIQDWTELNVQYGQVRYQLDIVTCLTVPSLIVPSMLYLYVSLYLAEDPLLKAVSYTVFPLMSVGWLTFLLSGSALHDAHQHVSAALWDASCALFYSSSSAMNVKSSELKRQVIRIAIFESFSTSDIITLTCCTNFTATRFNTLLVIIEVAAYFLLLITTIGIPNQV